MKSEVLVTGGAGFLGSHLCQKLLSSERFDKVVCADNLQTGDLENIQPLLEDTRFEFRNIDVTEEFKSEAQTIFNLACPASPVHYQADPVKTMLTSVCGANNIAKLALQNDAMLFHTSTSEVYGDPTVSPQQESYWGNVNPIGIRSCYDEGKRAAETLLVDYHRQYGLNLKMVRIFNTYGPKMSEHDGRVVSNFISQALKGEDISIYGDGLQTRSFCYVEDLIEAFLSVAWNSKNLIGPFNIGNPNEFTIRELADTVLDITKSSSKLTFLNLPEDDPKQRRPDISYVKEVTGWEPIIELQDGISRTVKYFETALGLDRKL